MATVMRRLSMASREHKNRAVTRVCLLVTAILAVIAVSAKWHADYSSRLNGASLDNAFVEKLKSAPHVRSEFPAQKQTIALVKQAGLRVAALNAIGMEIRDVRGMATGSPEAVFSMLSHLGGYGEIIWVDQWTNFPVKLVPASRSSKIASKLLQWYNPNFKVNIFPQMGDAPRREAVKAALAAIDASGGCLIKAGKDRYLVARVSERRDYAAAIRSLGWLAGIAPPWVHDHENDNTHSNAEPPDAANGSQPIRPETNRTSSTAGSRR